MDINEIVKRRGVLIKKIEYLNRILSGIKGYRILNYVEPSDNLDTSQITVDAKALKKAHLKEFGSINIVIWRTSQTEWTNATDTTIEALRNQNECKE